MRIYLTAFLYSFPILSGGQDILKNIEEQLKPYADSVAISIDLKKSHRVKCDSLGVYDPKDIDKVRGYIVEETFWDGNKLDKALIIDYNGDTRQFYFVDSQLIKVDIFTNGTLIKQFYYGTTQNSTWDTIFSRIVLLHPELRDYYTNFQIGRSYLKQ